jgi:membrane-bound metal-dependent hydrolase YbcI (DUF457 family)
MILGQIGVGFALRTLSKSTNLGWIIASTLFLDALLWIFVLLGIEHYSIPANYEQVRHFRYEFPFSHGFLAALFWTFLIYILVRISTARQKMAVLMAIGTFSSLILNLITHPSEVPLLFQNSFKIGIGLSDYIYLDFIFELFILITGLYLYFKLSYSKTFLGRYGMGIFMVVLIYVDAGQLYLSPDPSSIVDTALGYLTSLVAVTAITYWLDKQRTHTSIIFKKTRSDIVINDFKEKG